jgi:chromosome segregation ATPase
MRQRLMSVRRFTLTPSWPGFAKRNPGHPVNGEDDPTGWPAFAGHGKLKVTNAKISARAIALLALLPISGAHAQSIEERLRDQLRATVNQLHQLQDDQAQLQAQKAQAEQERDQLKTELAAAKAEAAHNRSNGAQTHELEGEVSKYKDQYTQETAAAQKAQADHDKLQADLIKAQALVGACEEKNTALLKTGNEILDAYEDFDIGDAVGAREPFFQTKRVELQNEAQDFDDKLRSGKFDPDKVKLPAAAPAKGN